MQEIKINDIMLCVVGSYKYRHNYHDIDIGIISDKKVDIKYLSIQEYLNRIECKNNHFVNLYSYMYPDAKYIDKKKYISLLDYAIYIQNFRALDYVKQGQITCILLFAMNRRHSFSKKQLKFIDDVYEGKANNTKLYEKWKKFIKRKRSRSIGWWCFANDKKEYQKITKERLKHEKEDSNYVNIGTNDKPVIMWMSDEAKHLWKSKYSSNK